MTANHSIPSNKTPLTMILANFLSPIEAEILVCIRKCLIERHRNNKETAIKQNDYGHDLGMEIQIC